MTSLKVQVHEIRGNCPIFNIGDNFYFDDFWLKEHQGRICAHALPNILHYFIALREGISPQKLGLSKEENIAYIQCPDCGPPYTDGGSVIFKIMIE
jgi:uncharacterized repeat protein (TIGR04076 family)